MPVISAKRPRADEERRTMNGIVFDSIAEMEHYGYLLALQRDGVIRELKCQVKFRFVVNDIEVGTYRPDFTYIKVSTNAPVVEDVKAWKRSRKTGKLLPIVNREYGIKKKLMKACFSIEVQEV